MMSATAMPSNPFSRNSRPATSTTRARFFAACTRLTFMRSLLRLLDKLYDTHHQYTNDDRYHITGSGLETEAPQRMTTSKPQWFVVLRLSNDEAFPHGRFRCPPASDDRNCVRLGRRMSRRL